MTLMDSPPRTGAPGDARRRDPGAPPARPTKDVDVIFNWKDKDGKKIWTRIGAVWPNTSGKGFNLTWEYLPLGDGLTVMLPYEKEGGEVSPCEV